MSTTNKISDATISYEHLCVYNKVQQLAGNKHLGLAAKQPDITPMQKALYESFQGFERVIPLLSTDGNLLANFDRLITKVIPLDVLEKDATIGVTDPNFVYQGVNYKFIPTIDVVKKFIERGIYPQSKWVYKPKPRNKVKDISSWNAQLYHVISFIDMNSIFDPITGPLLLKIYKITGMLPTIELATAHNGKHSFRLSLSVLDVTSGYPDIISGFSSEIDRNNPQAARLVHSTKVTQDEDIDNALQNIAHAYNAFATDFAAFQIIHLSKAQQDKLYENIKSVLFPKRTDEIICDNLSYLIYGYTEQVNMDIFYDRIGVSKELDHLSLLERLFFIQKGLETGIRYKLVSQKDEKFYTKKIKKSSGLRYKTVMNLIFQACKEVLPM